MLRAEREREDIIAKVIVNLCEYKKYKSIEDMVEFGNVNIDSVDHIGRTALHTACINGDFNAVNFLIETCHSDTSIQDDYGNKPFHYAVVRGHIDIVRKYINKIDIDEFMMNESKLKGHEDMVNLLKLITKGIKCNTPDSEDESNLMR